jgi:hypothetical protein
MRTGMRSDVRPGGTEYLTKTANTYDEEAMNAAHCHDGSGVVHCC